MTRTRSGVGTAVGLLLALTLLPAGPGRAGDVPDDGRRDDAALLRWRSAAFDAMSEAGGMADPAVVAHGGGYVAVATGRLGPRAVAPGPHGPWEPIEPALESVPGWATGPEMWAADLARVGRRWLLYFSLPVGGLRPNGRCIGVAVAATPVDVFRPLPGPPLVCPPPAAGPRGDDPVRGRPRTRHGVIDPSYFRDRRQRSYLLYKTQGIPATIRAVRLTRAGLHTHRRARSFELVRRRRIIENPSLVRRTNGTYVLLVSQGLFAKCRYRTLSFRSRDLRDWSGSDVGVALDRRRSRLCGPGGADVVGREGSRLVFFHGWTCGEGADACRSQAQLDDGLHGYTTWRPQRSLYVGRMSWHRGHPRIRVVRAP